MTSFVVYWVGSVWSGVMDFREFGVEKEGRSPSPPHSNGVADHGWVPRDSVIETSSAYEEDELGTHSCVPIYNSP